MTDPDAKVRGPDEDGYTDNCPKCGARTCYGPQGLCDDCERAKSQPERIAELQVDLCAALKERDEARRERDAALKQLRERNENLDVRLRQVDSLRAQLEVAREGLSSAIDWLGKHQKPLSLNEVKQCLDHEKRCKEALAKLEESK